MSRVIDERADPSLRNLIGRLLARSQRADFAVSTIRLAAIDLTPPEMAAVRRCRILLGRLDARALSDVSGDDDSSETRVQALLAFIASDRVQIRNSGLVTWTPDFSIFHGTNESPVCLLGAHYFRDPSALNGPSLTVAIPDPTAVQLAVTRFEEIWSAGYDVRDAVLDAVTAWLSTSRSHRQDRE